MSEDGRQEEITDQMGSANGKPNRWSAPQRPQPRQSTRDLGGFPQSLPSSSRSDITRTQEKRCVYDEAS
jgi:hypothetical protein